MTVNVLRGDASVQTNEELAQTLEHLAWLVRSQKDLSALPALIQQMGNVLSEPMLGSVGTLKVEGV